MAENNGIKMDSMVAVAPDVVSADMGGEEVILNLTTGIYHGLNEVGTRIWALIEQPCSVARIHEALLAEYDIDSDTCLQDLQMLLADLAKAKLIEVR